MARRDPGVVRLRPVGPPPRRALDVRRVVLGFVLMMLLGVAAVAVFGAGSSQTQPTAEGHIIRGSMTLHGAFLRLGSAGCAGHEGYDDIRPGAPVVVKDQAGTVVGAGSLGVGSIASSDCVFTFAVQVKGADFYQVEVSHRGGLTFSKAQLAQQGWQVSASLG